MCHTANCSVPTYCRITYMAIYFYLYKTHADDDDS